MKKISVFIKSVALIYVFLGFFGFASATDFKLPNYKFDKSKEPIYLVDKLPLKGDMTISFDFSLDKAFNSKSSSQYQGLFETALGNTGVRIEIDKKRETWDLLIGDISGKFDVYNLGKLPNPGVWTKVKIQILNQSSDPKNNIILSINDKKTVDSNLVFVKFLTNKVTIGYGISPERKFHGSIRNFIISR